MDDSDRGACEAVVLDVGGGPGFELRSDLSERIHGNNYPAVENFTGGGEWRRSVVRTRFGKAT